MSRRLGYLLAAVGWVPFAAMALLGAEAEPTVFALGVRAAQLLPTSTAELDGEAPWVPRFAPPKDLVLPRTPLVIEASDRRRGAQARPVATLRVTAARVLEAAARGQRPTGVGVPAVSTRPAGIVLGGVSPLGIGAADGDVLTHVDGMPVGDPGEVVALVLSARAHRASSMRGRVYRGDEPYEIVVEMPYVDADADSRSAVASL